MQTSYSGYPCLNIDTNFQWWKKQISVLLECNSCLPALSTSALELLISDITQEVRNSHTESLNLWKKNDLNARSILLAVIEEPAFDIIESKANAFEMWNALCTEYEKSNLSMNCHL